MKNHKNDVTTETALKSSPNGGFAAGQATDFTSRYSVLNQFRDDTPTAEGGFSATLFQDKGNPNRLVLSFAGTEFETDKYRDLVTDAQIGLVGYAMPQALAMYRYIKRLRTGAGTAVSYTDAEISRLYSLAGSTETTAVFKAKLLADTGVDAGQGAGVALMLGMRIAMRRQLEPLSARARWALVAMLAVVGAGGYLVYALATRVLA